MNEKLSSIQLREDLNSDINSSFKDLDNSKWRAKDELAKYIRSNAVDSKCSTQTITNITSNIKNRGYYPMFDTVLLMDRWFKKNKVKLCISDRLSRILEIEE